MERVGFYPRAAAFLIDLMLFVLVVHVAAAIDWSLYESQGWRMFGALTAGAAWITLAAMGLLEALEGTSPGKRLMKVAIAAEDGRRAPRRTLFIRAIYKYAAVLLSLGGMFAFAVMMQWGATGDVRDGFEAIFWADLVVASGVTIFVIVGCFRALKDDRQAFHDLAAGTAVFSTRELLTTRGFAPVVDRGSQMGPDADRTSAPVPVLNVHPESSRQTPAR